MVFRNTIAFRAALTFHAVVPSLGTAQVLASPPGKVAQTIDGTTITIEYYRPVARGREFFGGLLRWGEIWTPGANWATTLEVDKDVRLNNHPLPKGKYSVWIQPEKDADWTVMLNKTARAFHLWPPLTDEEQLRFTVKPEWGPHVEVLTWSFPAVMRDGTALRMQWGTTVIPFHVSVEPSRQVVVTAQEKAGYVGTWTFELVGHGAHPAVVAQFEIVEANGVLRVKENPIEPQFDAHFDLIPIGGNQFHPSYYRKGEPFGVEPSVTFVFRIEDGSATSFEVRGPDDKPFARGLRAN